MSRAEQILKAAETLFFEKGFDGVGVDAIAEKAGTSGGGIYRHFSGKNEILASLFDQAIDGVLEQLPPVDNDHNQDLRNLVEMHVHFAQTHPELAGVWSREHRSLVDPYRRSFLRRQRRYVDRWRSALARRYPDRTAEEIAVAIRAIEAIAMSEATRPNGSRSTPGVERLLVDMALSTLCVLEG